MIKRTVAITSPAYLSLRLQQLVIEIYSPPGKPPVQKTVPIEDLGILVLETHQCTITLGLISYLLSQQVAIISCDDRHMPQGLLLPLEGHTLQSARFRTQLMASEPLKKNIWAQTIKQKIKNQGMVFKAIGLSNQPFEHWAKDVRSGDPTNLEARAAAFYWNRIFGEESNFKRGRYEEGANIYLNYGYAILRAAVARGLIISGLFPTFGVHHKNQYNAYCLADDMMEPYRPVVDYWIYQCLERLGDTGSITTDWKFELLKIPTLDVKIYSKSSPLLVAISKTCSSLYKVYSGQSKKVIFPELLKEHARSD